MTTKHPAPDVPAQVLDDAPLIPELQDVAAALLAEGFGVYYHRRDPRAVSWLIIERCGNVGTLQYDRLTRYSVSFAISPSRATGSALSVLHDGDDFDALSTVQELVLAAGLATQDVYKNFATPVALPNAGWKHLGWAVKNMTRLTEHDETNACEHWGVSWEAGIIHTVPSLVSGALDDAPRRMRSERGGSDDAVR